MQSTPNNNTCTDTPPVVEQSGIDIENGDGQTKILNNYDGKSQNKYDKMFRLFTDAGRGRSYIRISKSTSVGSCSNRDSRRSSSRRKRDSLSPVSKNKARKTVPDSVNGEEPKGILFKQIVRTQPKVTSSKLSSSKTDTSKGDS